MVKQGAFEQPLEGRAAGEPETVQREGGKGKAGNVERRILAMGNPPMLYCVRLQRRAHDRSPEIVRLRVLP